DAVRLLRLQAEFAECEVRTTLSDALDAALELLAVLCTLWLQHFLILRTYLPRTLSSVFAATVSVSAARALAVAFHRTTLGSERIVLKDFALEDPDLDAADTESGFGFSRAVVDVGAQGVQRNAAF